MRESFEVDYQDLRTPIHFHLLGCHYMVFALAAVPLVVAGQILFNHEAVEAVVQGQLSIRGGIGNYHRIVRYVLYCRLFNHLNLGRRVSPPVDHQYEGPSWIHFVEHVFKSQASRRELEVTVLFVVSITELALLAVGEEHA